MLRVGGRCAAPVSPFSLHSAADCVQPTASVGSNSLGSADTPLSRWFSDQLAEVAASAQLDQQASQAAPLSCHQQALQPMPRSLSSKQFSACYGRWADTVIEDMMASPGSAVDRSYSCSMRSEYGGAAGSRAPSPADSGMLPALSVGRAELASLTAAGSPYAGAAGGLPRARRPSLPPAMPRHGAVVTGSHLNPGNSSASSHEALETTARRLSLPPVYYGASLRLRRNGWEGMDQS